MSTQTRMTVHIDQIKPNPKNPRAIKDAKLEQLKQSLLDLPSMLDKRPLVCFTDPDDGRFVVLGGNQRLRALRELGWEQIPIDLADDWNEQERDEFLIKDNLNYGEWVFTELRENFQVDKLQLWGMDIEEIEVEIPEAKEDDYEIPDRIKTTITTGDLIEIGPHKIMCQDTRAEKAWKKMLGKAHIDTVITDPPYNVDYQGGTKEKLKIANDKQESGAFYRFLLEGFEAMRKHTKPGGAWYVWHASSEIVNFSRAFTDAGLLLKQQLIWAKNALVIGRQDYQWKHEPCLYGWNPGAAHYFTQDRSQVTTWQQDPPHLDKMTKAEMKKALQAILNHKRTSVLEYDKPRRNVEHPTMKPVLLIANAIENSSKPGEIIADGYIGSGTTMVAAHQLNRVCYGMDLDPAYTQVTVDRMHELDPQLKIYKNGKRWTKY